ncbi:MAG: hypothetical protein DPW18_14990 [Chloroflexi bacterium]|nr:hypothetical protein [Chloroflexota bacterium]
MLSLFSVLRFVHIVAGIMWAGGAFLMNLVIGPALGATGDTGRQFAGHLMGKTILPKYMMLSGLATVLAGTYLYGVNSNWFRSGWMMTGVGVGFGIGAAAGILALIFGFLITKTNGALAALGAQIQGKPSEAQMAAMAALRKRQGFVTTANMICIFISVTFMALARLLG